jgi:hypothetical protein
MDWQIKTMSGKSSSSQTVFQPGDVIVCLIYKDPEVEGLSRADVLLAEEDSLELPAKVLGRWQRVINDGADAEADSRQAATAAEDFFCSLFENDDSENKEDDEERIALKHLLALLLERKRILRPQGPRATSGMQCYLHLKMEREFDVPVVVVDAELVRTITETMGDIFLQI